MNANTAIFFVAAVIASADVFAAERCGRASVQAEAYTALSAPIGGTAVAGSGRNSVFATGITLRPSERGHYARMVGKAGRA